MAAWLHGPGEPVLAHTVSQELTTSQRVTAWHHPPTQEAPLSGQTGAVGAGVEGAGEGAGVDGAVDGAGVEGAGEGAGVVGAGVVGEAVLGALVLFGGFIDLSESGFGALVAPGAFVALSDFPGALTVLEVSFRP